jgi:signal transduction histidine kinase
LFLFGERAMIRPRMRLRRLNPRFFPYLRIWMLLSASVVLIIVTAIFLSRSLTTLNAGSRWTSHAESLRLQLTELMNTMGDMGSGFSNYILSHDESGLERGRDAAAALPEQIAALQAMAADQPESQRLIADLIVLARARATQTEQLRSQMLSGNVAALRTAVENGDRRRSMETARTIVAQLQTLEASLLAFHQAQTERARRVVAIGIVAEAALAIILLLSIAVVTVGYAERRRDLQNRLAQTLREADQRKDVFLATLSHELRNPLAPIRTATRLLEGPRVTTAEIQRSCRIISRQVRQMAALLDDLLDVSRITRGILALKPEPTALCAVLDAAVETAEPMLHAKRQELHRQGPAAPLMLRADPVRLTQVVANLLTNASKYTDPEGHITLNVDCDVADIVISIRDSGVGIRPDMLPRVFEMFWQSDSSREHRDEGLGIGLALVKGFVELHGGRVEAHSAGLNAGSEFIVRLPRALLCAMDLEPGVASGAADVGAAIAARSAAPPVPPTQAPVRRVLIADDNRDGAEIMAMLLRQSGMQVHVAHNGVEAVSLAAEVHPDVAVLDIGMPGMSGYEVAQRIRTEPWGTRMHLIAVTGWGQDGDKRRAAAAGFDHHLTKPVDPLHLEHLVATEPEE